MLPERHTYRLLVVSSSEKFNSGLKPLLEEKRYAPIVFEGSVSSAKRSLLEQAYDLVLINAPLPDETGIKFAIDLSADKGVVCLLFVKADLHEEVRAKVGEYGVFTLPKPTSAAVISQGLNWMEAMRARLGKLEKKTTSIEEKMEEIRLVNRAKWMLIENLGMTESDAHRYIEKQAMDRCVTRREVAEGILQTYR